MRNLHFFTSAWANLNPLLIEKSCKAFLAIVVYFYAAKILPREQLGELTLLLVLQVVTSSLTPLGTLYCVPSAIIHSKRKFCIPSCTNAISRIRTWGGFATTLLVFLASTSVLTLPPLAIALAIIPSAITASLSLDVNAAFIGNSKKYARMAISTSLIGFTIKTTLLSLQMGYQAVLIGNLIECIVLYYNRNLYRFPQSIDGNTDKRRARLYAKYFLKLAWPSFLSSVLISLYSRADQAILSIALNSESLAAFGIAIRGVELFFLLPMALAPAITAKIASGHDQSSQTEAMVHETHKLFRYAVIYILIVAILYPVFLTALFHDKYNDAIIPFLIMLPNCIFVCFGVAREQYFQVIGLQKLSAFYPMAGLLFILLFATPLMSHLGLYGAAMTSVTSCFIVTTGASILFPKARIATMAQIKGLRW